MLLAMAMAMTGAAAAEEPADKHQWLENVTDEKALAWVRRLNDESVAELASSDEFKRVEGGILAALDSDEKIPYVDKIGAHYYNLWKDKQHARGLWRRTTIEEFRKPDPKWETVLDLDALGKSENENWVWHGANCLRPDYTRCMLALSRGGADADVVREFDLKSKSFVDGGFSIPESKNNVSWLDRDTLFVGTDFGPGSMTSSGYPRVAKKWSRGTKLADAPTVFEGKPDDVAAIVIHDKSPGHERTIYYRAVTFFTNDVSILVDGEPVHLDKPASAEASTHMQWLFLTLREDWTVGEKTYKAGSLLVAKVADYLAGKRELDVLFEPTDRTSLAGYTPTKSHVVLNVLDNVKNRLYVLTPGDKGWAREPLPGVPALGNISASAVDSDESDDYWLTITDFLTPTRLALGTIGKGPAETLKQLPAFFDATGLAVAQHEATSKDGTKIPYFEVARADLKLDGRNPTILYGYGGFEVSELPVYSAGRGLGWLEKGGVFVVANIRGGGEFGPRWHQAALKANRHKAYEDFAAVAEDLVRRKVTSREHLGAVGGSNGGLLIGNMLTRYPHLFGALVVQVPLLDMRRYTKLLAGASWMGEYG
ncbi:MAG TPA: prolyl oligopeptidase family serine peptidase, partial [Xanthomonadales bacterium]|nr:prolyl oligopeptidase family serine peptidase [Xanthomonadales bacterium]